MDVSNGNELTDAESEYNANAVKMDIAYNNEGVFIGAPFLAKFICEDHGVKPEPIDGLNVCCIGFSGTEHIWYGWNDEECCGFGIGSRIEIGHIAYRPKCRTDFIEMLWKKYEGNPDNTNIKIRPEVDGITVTYDTVKPEEDDAELREQLIAFQEQYNIDKPIDINPVHQEWFMPYPETWGKGEWEALTLEDAKQMAIDYVNSLI
jgi:hypothetical protein